MSDDTGTAHLSIPIANNAIGTCYRRPASELRGSSTWNSEVGYWRCYWSFAMYCYWSSDSPIGGTIGVPIVNIELLEELSMTHVIFQNSCKFCQIAASQ